MKFDNQLRYGASIIAAYRGEIPLHAWLKNYFRENKQMGSRDRKLISSMVYGYYRLGRAIPDLSPEEIILAGLFLCNEVPSELLQHFRPDWNEQVTRSLEEKIETGPGLDVHPDEVFPWKDELSEGIDHQAFCLSFLQQPDLFLRIRPGYEEAVRDRLTKQGVDFTLLPPFTVRLRNGSKTEDWFSLNKEIVIQDYSSQRTAPFLQIASSARHTGMQLAQGDRFSSIDPAAKRSGYSSSKPAVWDACAASGGKSLLVTDINPPVDLTVSDIRESILHNLRQRFREAGIKGYRSFVADLSGNPPAPGKPHGSGIPRKPEGSDKSDGPGASGSAERGQKPEGRQYNLVIADVPCTGSGTWSRTPEELYFFDKKKIGAYSELQRKILSNLIPAVRPGGHLVYITCSVFREENEAQVGFILENSGLRLEKMELLKGYDRRADTMFVARFVA